MRDFFVTLQAHLNSYLPNLSQIFSYILTIIANNGLDPLPGPAQVRIVRLANDNKEHFKQIEDKLELEKALTPHTSVNVIRGKPGVSIFFVNPDLRIKSSPV